MLAMYLPRYDKFSELTEEDLQDPWSHSDWDNMLLSVLNIWKTSPVKRVCDRLKGILQLIYPG